jgi:prepilin-type N-terminal cleavage/methylation domain-containing protein
MSNRGVTLIEILLAIIVMAIGMVGILALFPPTLESGKVSMEETHAAILANSVKQALSMALKRSSWDASQNRYTMVLTHDMKNGTSGNVVVLPLPKITEGWWHYPGQVATGDPSQQDLYAIGADPWIWAALTEVWNKNDPSDPYDQFAFSFDIRKINNIAWLNPQPPANELEQRTLLYDFRVHVFRRKNSTVLLGGEGNTTVLATGNQYDLITTITFGGSLR